MFIKLNKLGYTTKDITATFLLFFNKGYIDGNFSSKKGVIKLA